MWKEIGKSAWHVLQCWSHSGYLCKSQKDSLTLCGRRTTQTVCLQINELGPGSPIQLPSDPYPLKIWAAISNWFASPFFIPPTSSNVSPPFFFNVPLRLQCPWACSSEGENVNITAQLSLWGDLLHLKEQSVRCLLYLTLQWKSVTKEYSLND